MNRCAFYIDGFNLYHSLYQNQKWLDLLALVKNFIASSDRISYIKYFSTYCTWDSNKAARHKLLTDVYVDQGIEVIMGKFKKITRHCRNNIPNCSGYYSTHEEKQTDVNIALHLLNDAWEDRYDKAYIISGDTDLLPVIQMLKTSNSHKLISVIFPPFKWADEIKTVCQTQKMKQIHLNKSILPQKYYTKNNVLIEAPPEWI